MEEWMVTAQNDRGLKSQLPTSWSHYSALQNPPVDCYHTPHKAETPGQGEQHSMC